MENIHIVEYFSYFVFAYALEDRLDTMHSASILQNLSGLKSLIRRHRSRQQAGTNDEQSLSSRLVDIFLRTWDLGFTAFGGPPVHFRIFHQRFVEGKTGEKWVDEQTVNIFYSKIT